MARQLSFPLRLTDLRPEAFAGPWDSDFRELDWERTQRSGPDIVLIGAVAGFIAGLLLWGSLAMSIYAATDRLLGSEPDAQPVAGRTAEDGPLDCASFGAVRALSADDEARFQAQCGAAAPVSTVVPNAEPAAPVSAPQAPVATAGNRANCDQIRGTEYLSGAERTWYLANCVTP